MNLNVIDRNGEKHGSVELSDSNFDASFNETLVHQVSVACRAAARAGTKAQKNRSAVRGGGRKPWRQKGMGRARAGTLSSPIFRGGGATFAASPRSYEQKVNRKSYRVAMRCVLSELLRRGLLIIVSDMDLETHKTRELAGCLSRFDRRSTLIVDSDVNENLYLASRNLPNVDVIASSMLNPALAIDSGRILMTQNAAQSVDEWLK